MVQVGLLLIKYVEVIGIYHIQPGESKFNRRNVGVLLIFSMAFISVSAYLLFGVKTVLEFEECFFMWTTLSGIIFGFLITISETVNMFQLLEIGNSFIEKRKCKYFIKAIIFNKIR